eukprot:5071869-Ditylum_brightwellii.AAC.1
MRQDRPWGLTICHVVEGSLDLTKCWLVSQVQEGLLLQDEVEYRRIAGERVLIIEDLVEMGTKDLSILFVCECLGPISLLHPHCVA